MAEMTDWNPSNSDQINELQQVLKCFQVSFHFNWKKFLSSLPIDELLEVKNCLMITNSIMKMKIGFLAYVEPKIVSSGWIKQKKIIIKKAMKSRPFTKFLLKKTNENHVQLLTTFVLLLFSISEKYESSVFPIMNCIVLYHTYRKQI